ncbi:MAG: phosphonoacetaldehyde reductase [Nanoarchaeota archaeon]
MPQEYFGLGSIGQLNDILSLVKPKSIFLVRGQKSYRSSGAEEKIGPFLARYPVTEFAGFSSNTKIEDVKNGLELFRERFPEGNGALIMAIGGGSVLDLAKGIALLANNPGAAEDYVTKKKRIQPRIIPFMAIPTTAGTGSEATHFAAIYVDKTKYSLAHPSVVPDYAIIDPSLTFSLPPYQTACTGLDALAQAIESYWSIHAGEESKQYAGEAIRLALAHLEKAVTDPTPRDRVGMAKAANLAGKAINLSFTTACHALSYPLTSYFGIPHGHAVALTLPEMVIYNSQITEKECNDSRGVRYVRNIMQELVVLFGVDSAEEIKRQIEQLMDHIGVERRLSPLGVASQNIAQITADFNAERGKNNPRQITREQLQQLLEKVQG